MPEYPMRNGAPSDSRRPAAAPGLENPAAMRTTIVQLRSRVAVQDTQLAAASQLADDALAAAAEADARRNAAENRLAAVREILARALGGPGSYPDGCTEVDMAEALRQSLVYARNTAQRAHDRRRVNEAMTTRLLADLRRAETELAERDRYPAVGVYTITPAGLAALDDPDVPAV